MAGTVATPLTVADTLPPAHGVPPAQFGWFQVAPDVPHASPTVFILVASPNPIPSVQAAVSACSDSVAVVGTVVSWFPVPRVTMASTARVTVTRPCHAAGIAKRTSARIPPSMPLCPVYSDGLAPLLLSAAALLMKVSWSAATTTSNARAARPVADSAQTTSRNLR